MNGSLGVPSGSMPLGRGRHRSRTKRSVGRPALPHTRPAPDGLRLCGNRVVDERLDHIRRRSIGHHACFVEPDDPLRATHFCWKLDVAYGQHLVEEQYLGREIAPPTQVVSIRLPSALLNELRALASARDVPYQALIKLLLTESLARRRGRAAWEGRPRT